MNLFKYPASILAIMFMLHTGTATAIEYFPSEPGPIYNYPSGPVTIHPSGPGQFVRTSCYSCFVSSAESFTISDEGDVFLTSLGWSSQNAPDPEIHNFDPPLTYLDFPLEQSKTWSTTSIESSIWGGPELPVTLTGIVLGQNTVSVPAGDFEVTLVYMDYDYGPDHELSRTEILWLHSQLGPVNDLISWSGVVSTEVMSWSSMKALYR